MKIPAKVSILALAALPIIAVAAALTTDGNADKSASILSSDQVAPLVKNASAIIYAPGMAQGSLFRLRGAVGSAWFTRKDSTDNWCDVADMRLVAGDFGGNTIGVRRDDPVILIALNPVIANQLSQGQDVVSGDYAILDIEMAATHDLIGIDIVVAGSGHMEANYIMNPGSSLLNDIFGASSTDSNCEFDSAHAAIIAN
jgi:hypothetical protein